MTVNSTVVGDGERMRRLGVLLNIFECFFFARREMVDRGRWELRDLVRCNQKRSDTPAGTQILHDIIIVERAPPNNGIVSQKS